jgi:hypothetical protein
MESSRFLMLKAALNAVLAKEIALLWLFFSKNVKDVGVYGMHELVLKLLKGIIVVVKNN